MLTMVEYVHQRLKTYPEGLIGVDMTMGNGHDTLALLHHCREVYSFDVQEQAIHQTRLLTGEQEHVHLILDGHQNIDRYLSEFDIGIFNLGYLPLSDHHITTLLETTQIAIKKAIDMFHKVLWIVVYPGHQEGYQESLWIHEYVQTLDTKLFNVSCYCMLNKHQSPYVIEIEKRATKNSKVIQKQK